MNATERASLPVIPVIETGADFPYETLVREEARAHALLNAATRGVPRQALRGLDAVSRRWLARWHPGHLAEIDRISARLARPGAYFLSVNYEWGCTTGVRLSPDGATPRLVRVLDWRTPGLGRHVLAAQVAGAAGPFVTLTWPGYTGVLQASAQGRFAGALNQAPLPQRGAGAYPVDWLANKVRLWRTPHVPPAHLLRHVFETATDFGEARRMLIETPVAAPVIFALAGTRPDELAIIERLEEQAHVFEGTAAAANAWQAPGWRGRPRGQDSVGRVRGMAALGADFDAPVTWLRPPILNPLTRLALVAEPATGRLVVQGFEHEATATRPLHLGGDGSHATIQDNEPIRAGSP